ncbi:MAG: chromosome partitioning protein ParB [Flavobacteriales bacterium]|nr:chromosome partitioning protein ParB [Flavobacteriales bacterium]
MISEINIDLISKNKNQPRLNFKEQEIEDLAVSIKKFGLIQPITVRKKNNRNYELISGERRLRAFKLLKLEEITAFVKTAKEEESLEMALIENIQRENLNPIEIALSFKKIINQSNITQEELSKRVGKSRTLITNHLRLLNLPTEIQYGLANKKISIGHAKPLITLNNQENQINIFEDIIKMNLSVRETEEICKTFKNLNYDTNKQKSNEVDFNYLNIKNMIEDKINSQTDIKVNKKGGGQVKIYFNNLEDLKRIWNKIK